MHFRKYIEKELLSGKTQQEVFNNAVVVYDVDIQDIADAIRKTPSLKKRNRYKLLNYFLFLLLCLNFGVQWLTVPRVPDSSFISGVLIAILVLGFFTLMLLYGIFTFKRYAHLITALFFTVLTCFYLLIGLFGVSPEFLFRALISLCIAVLAYFLNAKLSSDYSLNPDTKKDPAMRTDAVIFEQE